MNSQQHPNHPTINELVEYSSGSLPMSRAVCISAHLEHCIECQQQTERLSTVAGNRFKQLANVSVSKDILSATLQKINQAPVEPKEDSVTLSCPKESFIPRCLLQFIPDSIEKLKWNAVSTSVRLSALCTDTNGAKVALARIKPGGSMPHHQHTGDEITVILKGSFSDEDGVYHAGDYIFRDARHKHNPIVTNHEECICLMVMDAPIQFTGFFTRLLNPFIRKSHLSV